MQKIKINVFNRDNNCKCLSRRSLNGKNCNEIDIYVLFSHNDVRNSMASELSSINCQVYIR